MKKIYISISILSVALIALGAFFSQTKQLAGTGGTTNRVVFDIRNGSTMSLTATFQGLPWHRTVDVFGVNTNPVATAGSTLQIALAGVTNIYYWTNSKVVLPDSTSAASATNLFERWVNDFSATPPTVSGNALTFTTNSLTLQVLSSGNWASIAQTNFVQIGVTTNAATNGGPGLYVSYAGVSNLYYFTNDAANVAAFSAVVAGSDVITTLQNLQNRLALDYPTLGTAVSVSNLTLSGILSGNLAVTVTNAWSTNLNYTTGYIQITNNPTASAGQTASILFGTSTNAYTWTNAPHIPAGSGITQSVTNMFNRLYVDYTNSLLITMTSTNAITLVTPTGDALAITNVGPWMTNGIATNPIAGFVGLKGYKGNDGITWIADTAYDSSIAFSGVGSVTFSTNLTSLPSFAFLAWDVQNNATNCATADGITLISGLR